MVVRLSQVRRISLVKVLYEVRAAVCSHEASLALHFLEVAADSLLAAFEHLAHRGYKHKALLVDLLIDYILAFNFQHTASKPHFITIFALFLFFCASRRRISKLRRSCTISYRQTKINTKLTVYQLFMPAIDCFCHIHAFSCLSNLCYLLTILTFYQQLSRHVPTAVRSYN